MASNRYCVEVAKRGTAGCKNCKAKIDKGLLRIAKIVPNPFTDSGGEMKQWYHAQCMFQALSRARATTKKIECPDDLEEFDDLDSDSKNEVLKLIAEFAISGKNTAQKTPKKPKKKSSDDSFSTPKAKSRSPSRSPKKRSPSPPKRSQKPPGKDDTFREFRRVCAKVAEESSYKEKTAVVSEFFKNGSSGKGFDGDLHLWLKIFLPMVNKRVYNLQSKQLVKLFCQIFDADQDEMLEDLDKGDVAETVATFFECSSACAPTKKSTITLQEVDDYLDELTRTTTEKPQMALLKKIAKRCTSNDLKMFIRLIKHDLRINAGPKHILEALHPTAYEAFQASRDLNAVINQYLRRKESGKLDKGLTAETTLMTPVLPMLAQPCRSFQDAFKRCPNGLFVEIKYDGERVQVHKQGDEFRYFSRSLKPVMPHKISHFKDHIPKAFPFGNDLILDSEILLVDNNGKPLPFGSLGAHKKSEFKDATVCLFVFDCLQFNDDSLMKKPLEERRKILLDNMKPVKNHVMFSEQRTVEEPEKLKKMMMSAIKQGLEGLLIKDRKSIYEPGKRHWLKMKKDYIASDGMADSADLVVVGAYYGTGNKGGLKSVFLMGCLNTKTGKWCTVTKVGNGHDDATIKRLQTELKMTKISKDASKVPAWLNVNSSLVPDFVIDDPKDSQVWEITGAEFSKADIHTAGGISIRFPRVTRIRDDKTYKEATTLQELQELFKESKNVCEMVGLGSSPVRERSRSATPDIDTRKRSRSRERSSSGNREVKKNKEQSSSCSASESQSRSRSRSKSPKKSTPKKRKQRRSESKSPDRERSSSRGREKKKSKKKNRSHSKTKSRSRSRSQSKSTPKKKSRSRSKSPVKKKSKKKTKSRSPSPKKSKPNESSSLKKENIKEFKSASSFELPSIFSGIKLHLPDSLKDKETLLRYFIAYDGELLNDFDQRKASYVITTEPVKLETKGLMQITPEWLWDSIKLQKLLPAKLYLTTTV